MSWSNIRSRKSLYASTILLFAFLLSQTFSPFGYLEGGHLFLNSFEDFEAVMKERRQRLSSICASHVKGKPGPDKFEAWDQRLSQDLKRDSFLVDHKRKLLYCWNHKVYKIRNEMAPHSNNELLDAANNYTNILLVRPPLDRLISAYRDRVAGKKLDQQFYENLAKVLGIEGVKDRREVTWPQFVEYLLKTNPEQDDAHWKSYTQQCSPCLVNFTFIVHIEKVVGNTTRLMNPTKGGSSSKQDVLRTYLGLLDCLSVRKLFERYYADFLLFNYSLVEILGLARNAPCKNLEK